jgi:hypothetical protein
VNVRSILRLVIGIALAAILLSVALPYIGIPRSHLLPPGMVYAGARGKTQGIIVSKRTRGTPNPFRVGLVVYLLEYQFAAKTPANLGESQPGKIKRYRGVSQVEKGVWDAFSEGNPVPVRYDPTHPDICGIDLRGAGRSEVEGSAPVSGWLMYVVAALILGYMLTPLLERILPRGDM